MDDSVALNALVGRAAGGDAAAWGDLVARFHERLRRMVVCRIDPRLRARVAPSDVLQETYLAATHRLPQYTARPDVPFYLWLRVLAGDQLARACRFHLGAAKRDAARDVPLGGGVPPLSSVALAEQLVGPESAPDRAAERAESLRLVRAALDGLDPLDREILALRHFEQVSNAEAAQVLGVQPAAASKRYVRALLRLKTALASLPGGWDEGRP